MKTKNQTPAIGLILMLSVSCILSAPLAQAAVNISAKNLPADSIPAKTEKIKADKHKIKVKGGRSAKYTLGTVRTFKGIDDPELTRLSKEVQKHGEAIGKYYESADFKAKTDEMSELGEQMGAYYTNDDIKRVTAEQQQAAEEFKKAWDGKGLQMEQLGKQMSALGKQMEAYYNSAEFKELNTRLAKKHGVNTDAYNTQDENYKKYQEELKQNIPTNVKKQSKQLKELGAQMRSITNDPELRQKQQNLRQTASNLRKAYNNSEIKAQREKMHNAGQQIRSFANIDQVKQEKQLLHEATKNLREYMHSPGFKKKLQEYKQTHPEDFSDYDSERPERR